VQFDRDILLQYLDTIGKLRSYHICIVRTGVNASARDEGVTPFSGTLS